MNRRLFLALGAAALVTGCGFELRRSGAVPFARLFIDAAGAPNAGARLSALIQQGGGARLTASAGDAQAVVRLGSERTTKTILSLSGAGRVTEYRLGYALDYRVENPEGAVIAETERIELLRDMTFDDRLALAKGEEETLLYRDMVDDAARRILRRLQALGGARTA